MFIKKTMGLVASHITDSISKLDDEDCENLVQDIIGAKNIYMLGVGRSGFICRAFAMRLMHLGLNSYVIGETTTPPIQEEDILIVISGSGVTEIVIHLANFVKNLGIRITTITSNKESPMVQMSDSVIMISGKDIINDHDAKLVPMGTIFEITSLIFLDSLIAELMDKLGVTEKQMRDRHYNSIFVGIM